MAMTGPLWSAEDAAFATGGRIQGAWSAVSGVSIDTRELAAGDLFVALRGESRDGHAFVPDALAKGAVAMVSDTSNCGGDARLLVVDDCLIALEQLAQAARARTLAQVIAVTGSVGKTSTKEMLRTALQGQGPVHAAVRSFNNHWGVPLTLARLPEHAAFAVIEIGMNHPGEITPLSRLTRPHVAVITTVEAVHLAAFASVEEIADAKAEIFAGLEPGGTAILNRDNPHFARLAAAAPGPIISFGAAGEHFRLLEARISGDVTVIRADAHGRTVTFKIGAPGTHFARNALAALAAVEAAGGDIARAAMALAQWRVPGGRGSRVRIRLGPGGLDGSIDLIDESYNANPAAMRAALDVLAAAPPGPRPGDGTGRRVAFLGDMLELGPTGEALHASLADGRALGAIDRVHTCGPLMRALHDALPPAKRGIWAGDSAALAAEVRRLLDAGDVAMVKGSLGSRMGHVVEAIRALGAHPGGETGKD